MKTMKRVCAVAALLVVLLYGSAFAADFYSAAQYSEVIVPAGAHDGILTVQLEAEPDPEGYVYLQETIADMEPVSLTPGENVAADAELEKISIGDIICYRVKAADSGDFVTLTAQFSCPGFYGAKEKVDKTGSPATPITYQFTNRFTTAIGKYSIKVLVPQGTELIKVSTPAKYAGYTLLEEDGMRGICISKKNLGVAAAVTLNFTIGTPFTNGSAGKILVWAICLLVGGVVLYLRLAKGNESH